MHPIPLLLADISQIWYALPLIVVVALVYSATRHELMEPILMRALRTAVWIGGFMAVVFAILMIIEKQL